ncbi:MAG: hypothetical protein P8Z68_03310 [Kineosporiaceae bacterium]
MSDTGRSGPGPAGQAGADAETSEHGPESGPGGPLRAVLAAVDDGAGTLAELARRTGLDRTVVDAAVHHLQRSGHLDATVLAAGCPTGGCGGCAAAARTPDGASAPGCGAPAPADARIGPVLVAFTRRK